MFRYSIIAILFLFSGAAFAQDLNYSYLQLNYGTVDIDDLSVDGDGFGLDLSFALTDEFYIVGNYETAGLDFSVDLTRWNAGVGFNSDIGENLDFIAELSYMYAEVDAGIASADDSGILGRVGVRGAVSNVVELQGAARYDEISEEFSFDAGALFNFNETFALGIFGLWEDGVTTYRAGARLNF